MSRAKIHRDFNTFNSFIIRFAPTPRTGNASDMLYFSSPFFFLFLIISGKITGYKLQVAVAAATAGEQLHRVIISPFTSIYQ